MLRKFGFVIAGILTLSFAILPTAYAAGTSIPAGLSNTSFHGSFSRQSSTTTGSVTSGGGGVPGGVTLGDDSGGTKFACGGVTLTQGDGVNMQGGFPPSAIHVTNATAFEQLDPNIFQKLEQAPEADGIHFLNTACGEFTLDQSIVKPSYEIKVTLVTPWGSQQVGSNAGNVVPYSQQYCPTGEKTSQGWNEFMDELGSSGLSDIKQTGSESWESVSTSSSYNLQFACAGLYNIEVINTSTGKVISSHDDYPVPPNNLNVTTPPPPSSSSSQNEAGNLWISK